MLRPVKTLCPRCTLPVTLRVTDQMTVINGPYMSGVILQHPKHTACSNCGTVLAPAILKIRNLDIIATPVPEPEEEQHVIVVG